MSLVAAGLPTGNRGNLETLVAWAVELQKRLPFLENFVQTKVCMVFHHGDFFAGTNKKAGAAKSEKLNGEGGGGIKYEQEKNKKGRIS